MSPWNPIQYGCTIIIISRSISLPILKTLYTTGTIMAYLHGNTPVTITTIHIWLEILAKVAYLPPSYFY